MARELVESFDELLKGNRQELEELYNLDADIGETKNLAAENPELIAELKRQMEEITNRK